MSIQVGTDDGWVTLHGVTAGPIEFEQSDWGSDVVETMKSFSATFNFDVSPEMLEALRAFARFVNLFEARRIHKQYRAKTRRRNRRRK